MNGPCLLYSDFHYRHYFVDDNRKGFVHKGWLVSYGRLVGG